MQPSDVRLRLAALEQQPSADDLTPIVEVLERACRQRAQPRKSLAMHLRNAKGTAAPSVLREVSQRVIELLDRGAPVAPAPTGAVNGAWVDVAEAARILGLQRATLTERLRQSDYRYLYGWPHWDGHQWWFSTPALDPGTRVEFLSRLPNREPDAHVTMLPPWCSRQQPVAADARDPRSGGS